MELAAVFARMKREQNEHGEEWFRTNAPAQPSPAMPSFRRRVESSAPEEGHISPHLSTGVEPAGGAALAKLNVEHTALRQAAADSNVGAGRLFARPTPAQLLKSGNSSGSKPAASMATGSKIQKQAVPDSVMQSRYANIASGSGGSGLVTAAASLQAQDKDVSADAKESTVGAGRLFSRPSPAELLNTNGAAEGQFCITTQELPKSNSSPPHTSPPQPPKKSPAKGKKVAAKVQASSEQPVAQAPQSVVLTPPKVQKKKAPVPTTIHPDAIQIGRLDPIVEDDEEGWTSNSEEGTPREMQTTRAPNAIIQFDHIHIQDCDSDTEEVNESSFAGVGSPKDGNSTSGVASNSNATVHGLTSGTSDQERSVQAPKSSSSLQQLPLIKLETRDKKPTDAKRVPLPQYQTLQEADDARETEVLRRQQIFDSADSLTSANIPLELVGALSQGMMHKTRDQKEASLDENHEGAHRQDFEETGKRSSTWTDFARERARALGQAVDDAEYMRTGKATLKLKPGVHDVLLWLRNIGWGQYEETFAINQIDYDELFVLTDKDLQQMGMKLVSNRLMLLNAIAALKQAFKSQRNHSDETTNKAVEDKTVFITGHDKRERDNSELVADQVNFEQKKGYMTWSDHTGKKWKRGFAVIQGSSLHIFKSSDHVVLKPIFTRQLQGALISSTFHAENCIYVQANSIKVGMDDVYLCAPDEEERGIWLQHLVAAASLQLLQHVLTKNFKTSLPSLIVMLEEFHVNKTGPYALAHLEIKLADKNGRVVRNFGEVGFGDLFDNNVLQPNGKGAVSQKLSQQLTLHKKCRQEAGAGSILFFEFKHTVREKSSAGTVQTQYWAYAFVDELHGGAVKLDLLKKPAVYDPVTLRKNALPKKEKSYVGLMVHVKDVKDPNLNVFARASVADGRDPNDSAHTSVADCSRALLSAIRSNVSSTDKVILSSVESLESVLEVLHVLDSSGKISPQAWDQISGDVVESAKSIVKAASKSQVGDVSAYQRRITELEEQLEIAQGGKYRSNAPSLPPPAPVQRGPLADSTEKSPSTLLPPPLPPPPPGLGVAPPAPPLPGTAVVSKYINLATAEYAGPTPSVTMRPLHWKKVPPNESVDTVWTHAQTEEWNGIVGLLEPAKMEILFSANQTVRIGADLSPQLNRPQKTALIDLRRAQNVSIMLSKFRCTFKELRQAVLSLDTAVLDVDKTTELIKFVPSEEEIELLKAYTGDVSMLGSAERFFLEVAAIHRYKERLQVHLLILTFDDRCTELDDKLSSLVMCLTELTQCKRLHRFMLHVLAVGNFMNHGTSMGNAAAFHLEVLNQAIHMRSNVDGVTLLHFLASHLYNTDRDVLGLPNDLAHCEAGANVSLSSISELMAGMRKEQAVATREHAQSIGKDGFKAILADFLPHAEKTLCSVDHQHAVCVALVGDAKSLYAEMRPSLTQQELCGAFATFKTALVSVINDNELARGKLVQSTVDDSLDSTCDLSHDKDLATSASSTSFSEIAPVQSILAGVGSESSASWHKDQAASVAPDCMMRGASRVVDPVEEWLLKHDLAAHVQVMKLNRVNLDALLELTDDDLQDLAITGNDKVRIVTAIANLKRERQGVMPTSEQRSARNHARVHGDAAAAGIPSAPRPAPRSRAPTREGPVVWGVCYGEAGEAAKGQKHGWIEVQTRTKTWDKVFAKRARNSLVLFASDADLTSALRFICLDGVVVHRSDDRRPFGLAARKSIFQETKDDVFLAADSAKEASSWEKALIKGSMWHAENVHAAPVAAAPLSNRRTSLTAGRATVTTAPSSSGTFAKGLTAQQVHSVGTTFTFKSKKTALSSSNDDTDASSGGVGVLEFPPPLVTSAPGSLGGAGGAGGGGASMSSLVEQVSLRSAPVEAALGLRLVHLDMPGVRTQAFQSPFIAITSAATVNGKLMLEPAADVQIRGLPGDEASIMSIAVTRSISIPLLFQAAADLSVCLEVRHQKPNKVSTRAWTFLPLAGINNGERRLELYAKPVLLGGKSPKMPPLKDCYLTLQISGCETLRDVTP